MSDNNLSIIKVSVHSFHEKYIESKTITFFGIDIINIISKSKWSLDKKYLDFKEMNDIIIKTYPNVPNLSGLSLFKVTSFEELTKRRLELEEYLTSCIKRKDIFNSFHFQRFLEIDRNCPELIGHTIEKICDLEKLAYSVTDFIYSQNDNVLFLCLSNTSVLSRINSMFSTFNFFSNGKSSVALGAVCIYHVSKNKEKDEDPNEYSFRKVWTISFPIQARTIDYDPIYQVLSVGLDNGKICSYKHTPGMHFIDFQEMINKSIHMDMVTGVAYDKDINCLYSCSFDKTFCVIDLKTQVATPIGRSFFGFTKLKFDKKNERIFLANEFGQVKVYATSTLLPKEVLELQTSIRLPIRALTIDTIQNYIFTGVDTGKMCILNLGLPGKERFINEVSSFGGESGIKIRVICYNRNKNELITGDEEGRVCIWSLKTAKLLYVWLAHPNSSISQMQFEEENQVLWTGGGDQALRLWKFPKKWDSSQVEDFEQTQIHIISEKLAQDRIQKALLKSQENEELSDSSDDDLNGWEK